MVSTAPPDYLPPVMAGIWKDLAHIYGELEDFHGDTEALKHIKGRLCKVDYGRVNGIFAFTEGKPVLPGQGALHDLLHRCFELVRRREIQLDIIDSTIHPDLLSTKKEIEGLIKGLEKVKEGTEDLNRMQGMLHLVEAKRTNGIFGPVDNPLPGQGVLHDLLNQAYCLVMQIQKNHPSVDIDPTLEDTHRQLQKLAAELDNFHGDSVALKHLQGRLHAIDNSRVDGIFGGKQGNIILLGQSTLHELMHRCYEQVRHKREKLDSSDVSHELAPIKKELESIIKELNHLRTKPSNEELKKIQGRLDNIDSRRVNGIFGNTSNVLAGQGVLHDLLNEAYCIVFEIQRKLG